MREVRIVRVRGSHWLNSKLFIGIFKLNKNKIFLKNYDDFVGMNVLEKFDITDSFKVIDNG